MSINIITEENVVAGMSITGMNTITGKSAAAGMNTVTGKSAVAGMGITGMNIIMILCMRWKLSRKGR